MNRPGRISDIQEEIYELPQQAPAQQYLACFLATSVEERLVELLDGAICLTPMGSAHVSRKPGNGGICVPPPSPVLPAVRWRH